MATTNASDERELITFTVDQEEFAVDIMSVQEIRGWTPATVLPRSPSFIRGVINLRGSVLSIIDLAARLGFPAATPTARHVIIVVQIGKKVAGLLVDAVTGILTVKPDAVSPTPDAASGRANAFIKGMMAIDTRMISLVELESLLPTQDGSSAIGSYSERAA